MVKESSNKRRIGSRRNAQSVEQEYQVEAILDKRVRGKKTQYLLKWKGYSDADNSWEDENRLNCPDLFKEFENRLKEKTNAKGSASKKSKNTNMQDSDEDFESTDNQSTTTITDSGSDSTKIDDNDDNENDHNRIMTRQSPRKKARLSSPSARRHSKRLSISQTKSRITSMSKDDSSSDDTIEEELPPPTKRSKKSVRLTRNTSNEALITLIDDDNNQNNNNSNEISGKKSARKPNTNRPTTRFRVAPNTTSTISFPINTNERSTDKVLTENSSEIVDETDQVERIETVRYYHNEISFLIKLIQENGAHWIPAKVANRKYPQAIIAFWESHVEFT